MVKSPVGKYAYIAEIYFAIAVLYLFLVCYGADKFDPQRAYAMVKEAFIDKLQEKEIKTKRPASIP